MENIENEATITAKKQTSMALMGKRITETRQSICGRKLYYQKGATLIVSLNVHTT